MANTTYTYIDLNLSTIRHPGTSDIVKRYDADAVRSAVKNILATNKGGEII